MSRPILDKFLRSELLVAQIRVLTRRLGGRTLFLGDGFRKCHMDILARRRRELTAAVVTPTGNVQKHTDLHRIKNPHRLVRTGSYYATIEPSSI